MIPGVVSKLTEGTVPSATVIQAKSDIVRVTGSTAIQTIQPALGVSQFLVLVPVDGAITLGAAGNIAVGIAAAQNRAVFMVYVKTLSKWVINSGV